MNKETKPIHVSRVRRKLAQVIEQEMLAQHGRIVTVDPIKGFEIARGFYRTSQADCYRWTATAILDGMTVGIRIDSYDTMTESAKHGIILVQDSRRPSTYDATARNKN
jgi:hypothetical protein